MSAKKNNKVKRSSLERNSVDELNLCDKHDFSLNEISQIQKKLLSWYDNNQRVLPWRTIAKDEADPNKRGYAVWVSEIMLQQTQVATVISYFNKWMKKWPTVSDLASADLEEVNKVWAGLGYYSRARRLHEGAKIVMEKYDGAVPQTVDKLMSLIPGIGMYSASAIASIAFQKPVGIVDGNVIRVLSRIRVIGSHVTQPHVRSHLWNLANKIVCVKRPGDFNQALMELGAVICTPQNPKCSECPLSFSCTASKKAKNNSTVGSLDNFLKTSVTKNNVTDIENAASCSFCLSSSDWKDNPQVTAFPCKIEKKKSRIEYVGVVVIKQEDSFLMTKRPEKGLLAGLWEFPSVVFQDYSDDKEIKSVIDSLLFDFGIPTSLVGKRKQIGEVVHIFSHIRTTYVIFNLELNSSVKVKNVPKEISWYTEKEIQTSAVSTAMKKVLKAVKTFHQSDIVSAKAPAKKRKMNADNVKQKSIKSFFTGS